MIYSDFRPCLGRYDQTLIQTTGKHVSAAVVSEVQAENGLQTLVQNNNHKVADTSCRELYMSIVVKQKKFKWNADT